MPGISERLEMLSQLRPFLRDEEAYRQVYADFYDLIECSEWLLAEIERRAKQVMTPDEIETFLIDLDVAYVQHASSHLKSLGQSIQVMLDRLADAG